MQEANETVLDGYQERMLEEYTQLTERLEKLRHALIKVRAAELLDKDMSEYLGFTFGCPIDILMAQLEAMTTYRDVLETRMVMAGIPIPE